MTRVRMTTLPDGTCVGAIDLPVPGGRVLTAAGTGDSKAEALHKAAMLAERIATDPVLQAILPPGTAAAILATKRLAAAAGRGLPMLRSVWSMFRGPGKRRVAKVLARERADNEPHEVGDVGLDAATAMGIATGPAGYAAVKAAQALAKRRARKKREQARKRRAAKRRGRGWFGGRKLGPARARPPEQRTNRHDPEPDDADADDADGAYEPPADPPDAEPDGGADDDADNEGE